MSVVIVRNGLQDGYVVRLKNMEERHFPTATEVRDTPAGGIELWNERIYVKGFAKDEYTTYWRVFREKPKRLKAKRTH